MPGTVPSRSKIAKKFTWNSESVFPSYDAWKSEVAEILQALPAMRAFRGRVAKSPAVLLAALDAQSRLLSRAHIARMYANFCQAVDMTDQTAEAMGSQAQDMFGQVRSAAAYLQPEILKIGSTKLQTWMAKSPRLAVYRHFFDDLFRKQQHVRSAEVEEVLGLVRAPLSAPSVSTNMLTNADFRFKPVRDSHGRTFDVAQGNYDTRLMHLADRRVRKAAYQAYMDRYVEFRNTLSTNLAYSIKANVFFTRARLHQSTLSAALFDFNIPVEVFHNLIDTFRRYLPVWHRYFSVRRRVLNLKKMAYYDMWAPITPQRTRIPFEKAVEYICASLEPLGGDYVEAVRRGCFEQRWVDVYPNRGKAHGAFSSGTQGTHPFIMMSYADEVASMSTLAHELGHSMHSYLTWRHQPFVYTDYSLFVAEVASNFHQAMLRGHLLATVTKRNFQIALVEEAVGGNFFRYFFQMPILARFELETHQRAERGEALTSESLIDLMAGLFAEGFGPGFEMDRERVGMTWATFPHLFADYYVYSYATGIAAAHALSGRILRGEPGAAEAYLEFLKAGSSDYSLNLLRQAGVDMTTPQPVEETFALMEGYIDRLEHLLS